MHNKKIAIGVLFASISTMAYAQKYDDDSIKMLDRFILSQAVATQCEVLDKKTRNQFLANLLAINTKALEALHKRHPHQTTKAIAKKRLARNNRLIAAGKTLVAQKGCQHRTTKNIIKLFYLYTKRDIFDN